jgi:TRAP-type C4-dicarboxylate transport system substrate-binding protein
MRSRSTQVALAFSVLLLLGAAGVAAQPVVVKMATLVPQGSEWHTTLLELVEAWKQASGGRVSLRLYPGGVAGDDGDVVRKIRLGTLDAGLLTANGLGDIDRSVFALAMPMMYASYDELDFVLGRMTPELERIYEARGFVILAWADAGWLHFFAKTPVRVPDDLKAQKLFTWAGDPAGVELWKSAGFNPVPLPSTEISTALQTGLVTAVTSSPQAAVLLQWYGHAPNMTEVDWAVLLGGMVISTKTWQRVPAELRPALLAAAQEAGRKLSAQTRGGATRDVEAMARRGLKVVRLDAETEKLWRDTAEAAYPTLRDRFVPGGVLDAALKLRQEYRTGVHGASGR